MKKLAIAFALVTAMGLGACGSEDPAPGGSVSDSATPTSAASPTMTETATPEPAPAPVTSVVTVTVSPPAPDATYESLLSAQLPSLCDMPPVQLVNGESPVITVSDGSQRIGQIFMNDGTGNYRALYAMYDVAGLGHLQVVTAYRCGYPNSDGYTDHILLVDHDGTTIATVPLGDLTNGGMTGFVSIDVDAGGPVVSWRAVDSMYDPAGSRSGRSLLTWQDGTLVGLPA